MTQVPNQTLAKQLSGLLARLDGRAVTVMGLGIFGGGEGAAAFLKRRGAQVTVTDLRPAEDLAEPIARLNTVPGLPIRWQLGGHGIEAFDGTELVVANPAVPIDSRWLCRAVADGAVVTTEIGIACVLCPARTVGVTGSNGKSTTTAMTHAILKAWLAESGRRAWLGGNLGGSLLGVMSEISSEDIVVLELSSFQLEHLDRLQVSPDVAVVTNLAPNHLDRHGSMDAYRAAKQTILRWQSASSVAVLNEDDSDVVAWDVGGRRVGFGLSDHGTEGVFLSESDRWTATVRLGSQPIDLGIDDWVKLPGVHNLANAAAAVAAAMSLGADPEHVKAGLESFDGLPHRLQLVADVRGRRFFDDSLATTPESVEVALASFDAPVVLLAGGYDKQVPLDRLVAAVMERGPLIRGVALMGQTARMLDELLTSRGFSGRRQVCASFDEAFAWGDGVAQDGDVVLLSPGCASYDWFSNFRDRGDAFARLVRRISSRSKKIT